MLARTFIFILICAFKSTGFHVKILSRPASIVMTDKDRLSKDNNDFISNIFAKFLPKPEDVGLKRYDRESSPETYPCVKDEWVWTLTSVVQSGSY